MAGKEQINWPSDAELLALADECATMVEVATRLSVSDKGAQHHFRKRNILKEAQAKFRRTRELRKQHEEDMTSASQSVVLDQAQWGDVRRLLEERGLSLSDWIIVRARVNEWGSAESPESSQLRVDLEPRMGMLMPARTDGWKPPKIPKAKKVGAERVALFGDHHVPHHNKPLHAAVCAWLREFKPDRGIILGDLLDLDAVSRHRRTPEWASSLQDNIDEAYSLLRGYIEASPGTRWTMLNGNHEERLRNSILDNLSALHGLTRAGDDDEYPVLSIPFLLRLDELGIEWTDPHGTYEHGQVNITSELAARHGWIASKGSGSSALKTIDHLRYSVIIGHTHRQSIVYHTAHSIDGKPRTLLGAEAGTLANIEGGLGYAVAPDWVNGFAVAECWPDGTFHVDLATAVAGRLLWRDWTVKL
jgi:Calcineurin-like phosphoesterase